MKNVYIYIENGIFLQAKSFGKSGTKVGEIVFNTAMSGYQEVISDPSYAGQFIVFTMPEIGIVGVNKNDMESHNIYAKGILVRNISQISSNFRSEDELNNFLEKYDAMGICDIDTRYLTKTIRDSGTKMMIASTEISDKEKLKEALEKSPRIEEIDYVKEVSTKHKYTHKKGSWDIQNLCYKTPNFASKKIAVIDFGVKQSILNELCEVGFEVEVFPQDTNPQELVELFEKKQIQGVLLSNGPGDPRSLKDIIKKVQILIENEIPLLGICLGHQLLSIAQGYETYKMLFGQHGANHPVKNYYTGLVEITSQNHNYNVPDDIENIAKVTHRNLFDNSIEGLEYKNKPIFSVQHHPEAGPGPNDGKNIFQVFKDRL